MQNRKIIYGILGALLVIVLILGFIIHFLNQNNLQVVFFNVGQGDSILISSGVNQTLIDGGKSGKILLEKLGKYIPFWDRKIEVVISTHPDSDHIGGLVDVFKNYKVQTVIRTNTESESQIFAALNSVIKKEDSEVVEAKFGDVINFSDDVKMKIIFPFSSTLQKVQNTNETSVVAKLNFGKTNFLFTGDLPVEQESEILNRGINIESQVLKIGHHGSKYSSSQEFLQKVNPTDTIISVGQNSYGHPNPEALERIRIIGAKILRTDQVGDIEYDCKIETGNCQRKILR